MSEFGWPMQVALVAKLVAENVCDGRVYDDVPRQLEYPYVRFSEISTDRNDATCLDYTVEQVTLHIHAEYDKTTKKSAKQIAMSLAGEISNIILNLPIDIGDGIDCFFNVLGETGRKDIKGGGYIQHLRIEAHLSKHKEL